MKTVKVTYWITTAIISLMMLYSVFAYLTTPDIKAAFVHLGYPDYFRIELAIAKFLGVVLILTPQLKGRFKEWGYFGFFINFGSAAIAHAASGDPAPNVITPLVFVALLITSYLTYHKLNDGKGATA